MLSIPLIALAQDRDKKDSDDKNREEKKKEAEKKAEDKKDEAEDKKDEAKDKAEDRDKVVDPRVARVEVARRNVANRHLV